MKKVNFLFRLKFILLTFLFSNFLNAQYTNLSSGSETSVQFRGVAVELIDVPTTVTASGKVVQFSGVNNGVNVRDHL